MVKEIIWTKNAEEDLLNLLNYLELEWTITSANNFLYKLDKKLKLVSLQPKIGRKTTAPAIYRRLLISKYNILIYAVTKEYIVIHRIKDTRQKK
jgi:plasmid stabilization system protein ParE